MKQLWLEMSFIDAYNFVVYLFLASLLNFPSPIIHEHQAGACSPHVWLIDPFQRGRHQGNQGHRPGEKLLRFRRTWEVVTIRKAVFLFSCFLK